jgi:hypothetical protein
VSLSFYPLINANGAGRRIKTLAMCEAQAGHARRRERTNVIQLTATLLGLR